jgi:hypothetical protein
MLPERDVQTVQAWIDGRNEDVPSEIRDQIRYEFDTSPHEIMIFECRPPWKPDFGSEWTRQIVAQLRFTVVGDLWSLYWRDSSETYHPYFEFDVRPDVSDLLAEIDRDPTAIFWG